MFSIIVSQRNAQHTDQFSFQQLFIRRSSDVLCILDLKPVFGERFHHGLQAAPTSAKSENELRMKRMVPRQRRQFLQLHHTMHTSE